MSQPALSGNPNVHTFTRQIDAEAFAASVIATFPCVVVVDSHPSAPPQSCESEQDLMITLAEIYMNYDADERVVISITCGTAQL